MENGMVIELAREAAAAARAEQHRAAAAPPGRKFRGVQRRGRRYGATLWNPYMKKAVWLGSYATPIEAAHAYDAAARSVLGRWARPNFPDPSAPAGEVPAPPANQAPEPAVAAGNGQQQPGPHQPQVPAPAPAAVAAQQQQLAALAIPLQHAAVPPMILRFFYRAGIGLIAVPFVPAGAYYVPGLNNVPVRNRPVSVALSSAAPVDADSQSEGSTAAAGEPERHELRASPVTAAVEPVVGDNYTGVDGASPSAARAYVP
ncbi:unnamed protein product [Urochloa humidicola]